MKTSAPRIDVVEPAVDLAVGELAEVRLAELDAEAGGDLLGELAGGRRPVNKLEAPSGASLHATGVPSRLGAASSALRKNGPDRLPGATAVPGSSDDARPDRQSLADHGTLGDACARRARRRRPRSRRGGRRAR